MYLYPLYLCKSYDSLVQNNFFRYIKKKLRVRKLMTNLEQMTGTCILCNFAK